MASKLSENADFKKLVDDIHSQVMQDFQTNSNITNIAVDIVLNYKRVAGTNNAQVEVKVAERRSDYYKKVVGTVTTQ